VVVVVVSVDGALFGLLRHDARALALGQSLHACCTTCAPTRLHCEHRTRPALQSPLLLRAALPRPCPTNGRGARQVGWHDEATATNQKWLGPATHQPWPVPGGRYRQAVHVHNQRGRRVSPQAAVRAHPKRGGVDLQEGWHAGGGERGGALRRCGCVCGGVEECEECGGGWCCGPAAGPLWATAPAGCPSGLRAARSIQV